METKDMLYLNPNYFIRHDETRSLLWARDEPIAPEKYLKTFHSFIHPYHAEMLTKFDGYTSTDEILLNSFLGRMNYDSAKKFIYNLVDNEKPYYISFDGHQLAFPPNLLLKRKTIEQRTVYRKPYINSFDFKELDFTTKRLNYPVYLTYMVNTICATDCLYCYADCRLRRKRQLSKEKIDELFDELESNPIIKFTIMGGEFLLDDNWDYILTRLKMLDLEPVISTKMALSRDIVKRLKMIGVKKIQVSLDSTNPAILHRLLNVDGEKYISQMAYSLRLLSENGISIKINSVMTRYNATAENIRNLLAFLANFNICDVYIIVAGFSLYKSSDFLPTNEDIGVMEDCVNEAKGKYRFNVELVDKPPVNDIINSFEAKAERFCNRSLCTGNLWQAYIMPNGDVTFCEGTMSQPDLVMGNIIDQPFREVWKKGQCDYLLEKERYRETACGSCDDFIKCHVEKGVCWKYVMLGYGKNNIYKPDPRCPKAPPVVNPIFFSA